MIDPTTFPELFARTHDVIRLQTAGLTHADSLLQPPHHGNCLNWVVGHIIINRDNILRHFDASIDWPEDDIARYKREAPPITDAAKALPFGRLLASLDRAQTLLVVAFQHAMPETWGKPVSDGTLADWIAFIHWHETYHVGQLELLRQLAGKEDKII
jgi:hypothetical protein